MNTPTERDLKFIDLIENKFHFIGHSRIPNLWEYDDQDIIGCVFEVFKDHANWSLKYSYGDKSLTIRDLEAEEVWMSKTRFRKIMNTARSHFWHYNPEVIREHYAFKR